MGISEDSLELTLDEAIEYGYAGIAGDESTYKQAMAGDQKDKWTAACLDEITSHVQNGTWKFTELPDGAKPIGSRFVLKIKHTDDESVERYKARLVAQGFSQRPG